MADLEAVAQAAEGDVWGVREGVSGVYLWDVMGMVSTCYWETFLAFGRIRRNMEHNFVGLRR